MGNTLKYNSHIKSWKAGILDQILVGPISLQQLLCRSVEDQFAATLVQIHWIFNAALLLS